MIGIIVLYVSGTRTNINGKAAAARYKNHEYNISERGFSSEKTPVELCAARFLFSVLRKLAKPVVNYAICCAARHCLFYIRKI